MQSNFLNLKPGDRAKVTVFGQGDLNSHSKLLTMKLISLVLFRVILAASLKDSLAILVNGFYLTLHSKEADILKIEMVKQ